MRKIYLPIVLLFAVFTAAFATNDTVVVPGKVVLDYWKDTVTSYWQYEHTDLWTYDSSGLITAQFQIDEAASDTVFVKYVSTTDNGNNVESITTIAGVNYSRTISIVDAKGNILQAEYQLWDNGQWVTQSGSQRATYTYSGGNIATCDRQIYSGGFWSYVSNQRYFYNNNGQLTAVIKLGNLNETTDSLHFDLSNAEAGDIITATSFVRDSMGNLRAAEQEVIEYDDFEFPDNFSDGVEYSNPNNDVLIVNSNTTSVWAGSAFEPSEKKTYEQLPFGGKRTLRFNFTSSVWQPRDSVINEKNSGGNDTRNSSYNWNSGNSLWEGTSDVRYAYTFDGAGNIDTIIQTYYDFVNSLFKNYSRKTYSDYKTYIVEATGVNEPLFDAATSFYPNPTSDQLTISITNTEKPVMLEVLNLNGQLTLSSSLQPGYNRIAVTSLPKGLYLLQFTDVYGRQKVEKLLVE